MPESDIVDITGDGAMPNESEAMQVDVESPPHPPVQQPGSFTTGGGGSGPGSGHRQNELRYSQRQKRPARHKAFIDELADMPQHMPSGRNGKITLQAMQAHLDSK